MAVTSTVPSGPAHARGPFRESADLPPGAVQSSRPLRPRMPIGIARPHPFPVRAGVPRPLDHHGARRFPWPEAEGSPPTLSCQNTTSASVRPEPVESAVPPARRARTAVFPRPPRRYASSVSCCTSKSTAQRRRPVPHDPVVEGGLVGVSGIQAGYPVPEEALDLLVADSGSSTSAVSRSSRDIITAPNRGRGPRGRRGARRSESSTRPSLFSAYAAAVTVKRPPRPACTPPSRPPGSAPGPRSRRAASRGPVTSIRQNQVTSPR